VFVEGGSVQIELTAAVSTIKQVEFIIRSQPQNGTLSAMRPHPRETNKGIVTYTHRGHDAPPADKFTFACRVDGGPVSAPATVTLTGKKFEPALSVEDISGIERVFLGGEATLRFSVKNTGAAPFEGDFAWPIPWHGPPRISLKAGEKMAFAVQFKPEKPGIHRFELVLQPGVDASKLPLYGECVRAFTVVPGKLALTLNPETGAREGVLTLMNGRDDPVRATLRAPERIEGAATSLDVPGRGKTRLSLSLPPSDVTAFQGDIIVESAEGAEKIFLTAEAKPVDLRVVSPADGIVALGFVNAGAQGRADLRVRNAGGATAVVQAETTTPFIVTPANQAVRIEPGAEAVFSVFGRGEQPGRAKGEVVLRVGSGETKVPVTMIVEAAPAPVAPEPGKTTFAAGGTASAAKSGALPRSLQAFLASSGLPIASEKLNPYLEPVTQLSIIARRTDSITVAWKKPAVPPDGWVIESNIMARVGEAKTFVKVWQPITNWKIVDAGEDKVAAQIHSLAPGTQFEVRIMATDRDGKFSQPGVFTLMTAVPEPLSAWFWVALGAGALGITLFVLLRIRSGGEFTWNWFRRRDGEAPAAAPGFSVKRETAGRPS
jgi:hypothetical protein